SGEKCETLVGVAEGWLTSVSGVSLFCALTGVGRGDVRGGRMHRGGARSVIRLVGRRLMERDHTGDGAEDENSGDERPIADEHGAGFIPPETADQVAHGSSFPIKR